MSSCFSLTWNTFSVAANLRVRCSLSFHFWSWLVGTDLVASYLSVTRSILIHQGHTVHLAGKSKVKKFFFWSFPGTADLLLEKWNSRCLNYKDSETKPVADTSAGENTGEIVAMLNNSYNFSLLVSWQQPLIITKHAWGVQPFLRLKFEEGGEENTSKTEEQSIVPTGMSLDGLGFGPGQL